MKKQELIRKISSQTGVSIKKTSCVLQSIFDVIEKSLIDGNNISLHNFGAFKLGVRNKKAFYNITTRNIDISPEHTIVRFVPYKALKKTCNPSVIHRSIPKEATSSTTARKHSTLNTHGRNVHDGKVIPTSLNIGTRRSESTSEFHNNKFAYIGTVAFDHYLGENDHSTFPAIKTPAKSTKILKWYKSNKDAVTGVTEPLLVTELEKLCEKYDGLKLLNHIAVPIQNREYSYRPDLALYWGNYNLCIDIEIDEPYDICSRKPLHYIGCSDNLRDTYFTRNGWCVIRYSEQQIINHIDYVVEHLDFVINWLIGNSVQHYNLPVNTRWTYDDAIQMANDSLREFSLNLPQQDLTHLESKPDSKWDSRFVKPCEDILPEQINDHQNSIVECQLNYALSSKSQYLRITRDDGYQFILEKNSISKGVDNGRVLITGKNPLCPMMSTAQYHLDTLTLIEPIAELFTNKRWSQHHPESAKDILVYAASIGAPIWIRYKNSQGIISERFLVNMGLCCTANFFDARHPFLELGSIVHLDKNHCIYICGLCSIRDEFRMFACDDRLINVKVVNCKYNFIYSDAYSNTLAELVMEPYNKLDYFMRVEYLLNIMPAKEKKRLLTIGNLANYEVFKGNLSKALELYNSIPYDNIMVMGDELSTWGEVCINDIEYFIKESKDRQDSSYSYDIVPSELLENFTKIKSLLIDAGWIWSETE